MKYKIKEFIKDIKKNIINHNYEWKFKLFVCLPIFLLLLFFDIFTKQLAIRFLPIGETFDTPGKIYPFLGKFIQFSLVYNKGIAFGANSENIFLTIFLVIVIILISLLIFIFLNEKKILIGLIMIITGGLGNLIDRFWNNFWVVDFLLWSLFKPYSIFNLADFFIVLGILIIILVMFFNFIKKIFFIKKIKKNKKK